MKNPLNVLIIIICSCLTMSSCNYSDLKKQNEDLKKKLEQKEETILKQTRDIEQSKSQVQILKIEIERLTEKSDRNNSEKQLSELYNDVKPAVYLIYTQNNEGISQGSAFVLSNDGLAISNQHVFEKASSAVAINEFGDKFLISEIIEENKSGDYIIFRLGPLSKPTPFVNISKIKTNIGENVFTVGNPKGLTLTLSEGIVSGYRSNFIQTTAEITNGSSGGPLFNKYGEVIGVTSSGIGEANLNFAIDIHSTNIDKYLKFESENKVNFDLKESELMFLLNKYYGTLMNEDFEQLSKFYSDTLSRYHSLFSISKNEALVDHKNYLKAYKIKSVEILPSTFVMYTGKTGYTMQYNLDYKIRKKSNNKDLNYILNAVVVIDRNGKIESIYDNILKKTNSIN